MHILYKKRLRVLNKMCFGQRFYTRKKYEKKLFFKHICFSGPTKIKTNERIDSFITDEKSDTESSTIISECCLTTPKDSDKTIFDIGRTTKAIRLCTNCRLMLCKNCTVVYNNMQNAEDIYA